MPAAQVPFHGRHRGCRPPRSLTVRRPPVPRRAEDRLLPGTSV